MGRLSKGLLLLSAMASLPGCASTERPSLQAQGSVSDQQAMAQRFDPYPETELSTDMDGTRPRGYQQPPHEIKRSRFFSWLGN